MAMTPLTTGLSTTSVTATSRDSAAPQQGRSFASFFPEYLATYKPFPADHPAQDDMCAFETFRLVEAARAAGVDLSEAEVLVIKDRYDSPNLKVNRGEFKPYAFGLDARGQAYNRFAYHVVLLVPERASGELNIADVLLKDAPLMPLGKYLDRIIPDAQRAENEVLVVHAPAARVLGAGAGETSSVAARGRGDPPQAFFTDYSRRFKEQMGPFDEGSYALNQREWWSTPVPTQTIHATVATSGTPADANTYVAAPSQRAIEELTPVASAKAVGGTSVHDALMANKRGKE